MNIQTLAYLCFNTRLVLVCILVVFLCSQGYSRSRKERNRQTALEKSLHFMICLKKKLYLYDFFFYRCYIWCSNALLMRVSLEEIAGAEVSDPQRAFPDASERSQCCGIHKLPRQRSLQVSTMHPNLGFSIRLKSKSVWLLSHFNLFDSNQNIQEPSEQEHPIEVSRLTSLLWLVSGSDSTPGSEQNLLLILGCIRLFFFFFSP